VSFWDWLRDGAHALYETNDEFVGGFRDLLPGFLQVNGIPVPTDLLLAGAFGTGLNPTVSQDYWTTFGVYLAQSQNGVAAVQQLLSAGQASQAAGTGEDQLPALIIANTYRVAIIATVGTRQVLNVVGVRGTAAGQELAAANAVKAAWETGGASLSGLHNSQYHVSQYVSTDLTTATSGQATVSSTAVGTTTGDISTMGACALIKLQGGTRSRTANGRMFWGPLSEGDVMTDGRTIGSANRTQFQTAVNTFLSSLSTASFPLVVISRKLSTAHLVASATVDPFVATQRRRIR
jgi:hypothetical protein